MNLRDKFCLLMLRAQGLLVDFTVVFLLRMGLERIGVAPVYVWPGPGRLPPLLARESSLVEGTGELYGTMLFSAGLPEVYTFIVWAVYAVACISIFGSTLGMSMAGICAVNGAGERPHPLAALVRHLLSPLSGILWIGYVLMLVAPAPGALHDLLTGTRVVGGNDYSACRRSSSEAVT